MILVNLKGRLGNQMFQYAVASIIAQKNKTRVLLDANLLNIQLEAVSLSLVNLNLNVFSNNYNIAREEDLTQFKKLNCINKIKRKFGFNYPNIYKEASFNFNPDVLLLKAPTYLEGYFQSYKYYFNHESFIKNLFTFRPNHLDNINKETALKIEASNSISIHIRRGDYITNLETNKFHGLLSVDYYSSAISAATSRLKNPVLFFFADDINWTMQHFRSLPHDKIFINHNANEKSWIDMFLMSKCRHNIIANSSFSWWGAWLNPNPDKIVIAPKQWFANEEMNQQTNDLIPAEWIRL